MFFPIAYLVEGMPPGHILKDQPDKRRTGSAVLTPAEHAAGSVPSTIAPSVKINFYTIGQYFSLFVPYGRL